MKRQFGITNSVLQRILVVSAFACSVMGSWESAPVCAQSQIHTRNQHTSVSDSFYEYNGVNWGYNFGNPNGNGNRNGSRSYGGFSFGAPAIPAFGGYSPNSAARFGFATLGKNPFHFGLEMGYGSNRSLVSNGVSTTSINGIPSSIFSGFNQPFVTGYIPVIGQGYYPYGGGFYPYTPYGYRVNISRRDGRTTSQMIRDSGHVGAHDHGHQHTGKWQHGGYHYDVFPIYGPACAVPYRNGFGYGYGNYGFGVPYNYAMGPSVGSYSNGFGMTAYSDGFGTVSATPIPGTLAAGIMQTQADAAQYWESNHDRGRVSATDQVTSGGQRDPLGNLISTSERKEAQPSSSETTPTSTATQRPESLSQIKKRIADEDRIETALRHAAIDRILNQARAAFDESDYARAIQLSQTALERCEDSDTLLRAKITRGIEKMREKQRQ